MGTTAGDGRGRVVSLERLRAGESGRVVSLDARDPLRLRKLIALGLALGVTVRVVQRVPAVVIRAGLTTLALDARTAAGVIIRRLPAPASGPRRRQPRRRRIVDEPAAGQ